MKVVINGQETEFADAVTITEIIERKGLNPATVIVELNCEIIKKDLWDQTRLKVNDHVELLAFVGGG